MVVIIRFTRSQDPAFSIKYPAMELLPHLVPVLCLGILVYSIGVAIYRLFYSPIANFPGPKLAALTFWYEFYHDVVRKGQYTHVIFQMHEKYGKVS